MSKTKKNRNVVKKNIGLDRGSSKLNDSSMFKSKNNQNNSKKGKNKLSKGDQPLQQFQGKGKNKTKWKQRKHIQEDEENSDFEVKNTEDTIVKDLENTKNSDIDSDKEQDEVRQLLQQQNKKKKKSGGFQAMGLSHNVFKGVTRKGYKIPTPIQRKTIPIIMDGKDVVAMARTGSGKTAAFLIPMFECLKTHCAKSGARALIMAPTRELALQTLKFAKELGKFTGLRAAVVLGGDRMEDQFEALHANPDIIIATPGRFMHVVVEMNLQLKSIQYVVFDEADRLFEMGFQEQLNEILNRLPEARQTVLFSATLPKLLVDFAKAGLHDPTLIRLDVDTKLSDQLKLSFLQCRADDKLAVLLHLLKHVIPSKEQTVVFAATKHHVEYLNMVLEKAEIPCTYIYSSLDPTARKINLAKFQHRRVSVMVVTDLAARGIDIPLLDNVINYHFPAKGKLFVHRVGRVARAGRSGVAYSLISPDEMAYVYDLHVFLGRSLKFVQLGKTTTDEDGLCGSVPQSIMDDLAETLHAWHEESYDIKAMIKVCQNAYGQYIRSRPVAAPESIKRLKEMEKLGQHVGAHPLFGTQEDDTEAERLKLLNALRTYKANTTIFEINSTAKNSSFAVMKQKRNFHDKVVESKLRHQEEHRLGTSREGEDTGTSSHIPDTVKDTDIQDAFSTVIGGRQHSHVENNQSESSLHMKKKRAYESSLDEVSNHSGSSLPSKKKKRTSDSIRDEENYISYRPADFMSEQGLRLGSGFDREVSGAILDMTGDEDSISRKNNNALKWDRKKKKYVRENSEDPKKKKIRTESGAWISASYKSNAYKDWVKKSRTDTQVERDDSDDERRQQQKHRPSKNKLSVMGVTYFNRRHTKGSEGGLHGNKRDKFKRKGSELKRPEQIVKARKLKARKQAFQKDRSKTHSKNRAKQKFKK